MRHGWGPAPGLVSVVADTPIIAPSPSPNRRAAAVLPRMDRPGITTRQGEPGNPVAAA